MLKSGMPGQDKKKVPSRPGCPVFSRRGCLFENTGHCPVSIVPCFLVENTGQSLPAVCLRIRDIGLSRPGCPVFSTRKHGTGQSNVPSRLCV